MKLTINNFRPSAKLVETSIEALSQMTETLSFSILVLFCVLVWSTSHIFRNLNLEIIYFTSPTSLSLDSSLGCVRTQLENWRRYHTLACQLVVQINKCFGIILLVAMTHSFVSFIIDSFEITIMAFNYNHLPQTHFVIRFGQHFFHFLMVCLGSYLLQSEVIVYVTQLSFLQTISLYCPKQFDIWKTSSRILFGGSK